MIIHSLLDTDLYKFTMMQAVLHGHPGAEVEYKFTCRNKEVDLRPFADEIKREIAHLCTLRFKHDELDYLRTLRFFKPDFVDFLRLFQFFPDYVEIKVEQEFELVIRGPWLHTILFEVPLLAIISEVYHRATYPNPDYPDAKKMLIEKIATVKQEPSTADLKFSDFGTRRRFSFAWHDQVVHTLKNEAADNLRGTSNVFLARKYNIMPVGTMAHEYLQAFQALGPRLIDHQKVALESWSKEYRGDLGVALSDLCGLDAFLRDFDLYFAKLFNGVRHDSGDPFESAEKIIIHYESLGIDPKTKFIVFSDNLNFPKMIELYRRFKDRIGVIFGIGTNLTNDFGHKRIDIVIKMTRCNGQPVAKISDSPGKQICTNESYLSYLKQVFKISG